MTLITANTNRVSIDYYINRKRNVNPLDFVGFDAYTGKIKCSQTGVLTNRDIDYTDYYYLGV